MALKTSIGVRYTKIKNLIVKSLKDKGVYEDTDEYQVDELVFNLKIADEAKKDILKRGLTVGDEGWRSNPSINIYHNCIKNINAIGAKLGITVQERNKLKFISDDIDDIDDLLN